MIPAILAFSLTGYNFVVFSSDCGFYLGINIVLIILSLLLLVVSFMALERGGTLYCTLWFIAILQVFTWSILSSTSHSFCPALDLGSTSVQAFIFRSIDSMIHTLLLTYCLIFICLVSRQEATGSKVNNQVENWLYKYLLSESSQRTVIFEKEKTFYKDQMVELIEFKDAREMRNQISTGRKKGIENKGVKMIYDMKGAAKKYRSGQCALFHFVMCLFSCNWGVICIGWIHLETNYAQLGSVVTGDLSIWIRIGALVLAVILILVKQFRVQYLKNSQIKRQKLKEEDSRFSKQSNMPFQQYSQNYNGQQSQNYDRQQSQNYDRQQNQNYNQQQSQNYSQQQQDQKYYSQQSQNFYQQQQ